MLIFADNLFVLFAGVQSVNGSSRNGGCDNPLSDRILTFSCRRAGETVIFDGNVPTLTAEDFQGNNWANQLLTLRSDSMLSLDILYGDETFQNPVESVEIVMFNCPEWGISVDEIHMTMDVSQDWVQQDLRMLTSCDSLVSVCLPVLDPSFSFIQLDMIQSLESEWVHIAEVRVHERGVTSCQSTSSKLTGENKSLDVTDCTTDIGIS